jgi:hypothetical protein
VKKFQFWQSQNSPLTKSKEVLAFFLERKTSLSVSFEPTLGLTSAMAYVLQIILSNFKMGFEQYHEPPEELSAETRTIARMLVSLTEEAEAINWYEQRISVEKDPEAKAIMENAQQEEFKHFGMDLEFLLRKKEKWRTTLKEILFKSGDIVELGEKGEKKAD